VPLIGAPALVILALLAAGAGAVAAVAGFGIGSILTPALALVVGLKAAVAAVAVPHAIATSIRLWALRPFVDRDVLLTFGVASAAGGLVGALLYASLSSPVLTLALGALLVLSGTSELAGWGRRWRIRGAWSFVAGALSGIFGGLVGNQGGVRSAALLRFDLPRQSLVATATATALLVDVARLPVYLVTSGAEVVAVWPLVLLLSVGVVVGTLAGVPILKAIPEHLFRRLLALLLIALGLGLIASVWVAP
jgi:uncharacterized membrane protein YfcA